MTPKEKAEGLVEKYNLNKNLFFFNSENQAKICALIAIDEIIEEIIEIDSVLSESGLLYKNLKYWQEVKQEIEKI